MSSSDSASSSSSDDEDGGGAGGGRGIKTSTTSSAAKPARLISSSSDSDDSSDDDSMTLAVKHTADKSRRGAAVPAATSTPLPSRHSIYTSSDNDDDDDGTDSDSVMGKKLKSPVASSVSKPSKKQPTAQSTGKKLDSSRPSTGSKPYNAARDSSTDSDAVQTTSRSSSVHSDAKKQRNKLHVDSSVLGGSSLKKEVSKKLAANVGSRTEKPVSHHHVSSSSVFGDALAKSAAAASHAKLGLKPTKDEKIAKKDSFGASSRTTAAGTHRSTSSDQTKPRSSTHTDVKSKHSVSESSRHAAAKSSGGSAEKLGGSQRSLKPGGHDAGHERKLHDSSATDTLKSKRAKHGTWTGDRVAVGTDSDESPLIRPGNIFEKMGEKQDPSAADKADDESQMFGGPADTAAEAHLDSLASEEIAVFMAESDDEQDHITEPAASKLSIERLKEDSAKEETIEEAVKAIIEFTKEPPLSSSKATDSSEPQEDTSHDDDDDDDDIGLSDELNAAIGNLIEKELEPGTELMGPIGSKAAPEADSSNLSPASTHYRPPTSTHSVEPSFVSGGTGASLKDGHMQTTPPAHDEQNVTSFMSRLEKATADVVDFAAISAAAAASRKQPAAEKPSCTDLTPASKPADPASSSRLFASPPPAIKTEDEKPTVMVKKEDSGEQDEDAGKPEPPEFPLSTRIYSTSSSTTPSSSVKPAVVHGVSPGAVEKPAGGAGGDAGTTEDCSTSADLYEFKDSDDDDVNAAAPARQEFVLHKRSRKRHADSESIDAGADVVDLKKLRTIYVKTEQQQQHETASTQPGHPSVAADQCAVAVPPPTDSQPPVSSSSSSSASVQSSWRSNMDLVIDAVARGEFERGDDFNFYTTQTAATTPAPPRGTLNTDRFLHPKQHVRDILELIHLKTFENVESRNIVYYYYYYY